MLIELKADGYNGLKVRDMVFSEKQRRLLSLRVQFARSSSRALGDHMDAQPAHKRFLDATRATLF